MSERNEEEFFVGYLPLPPRTKVFAWGVTAALAIVLASAGALAAGLRMAPAKTEQAPGRALVGLVDAQAYGVLWTVEHGKAVPVLLARGGKLGAPEAVTKLDGRIVGLTGLLLERDGYRLLEVGKLDEHPAVDDATRRVLRDLPERSLGTRTFRGEIVDIKCWLGRMKPGDGRTHRACAQFCIAGGIPPVLVTHDATGREQRLVITLPDGRAANEAVLPFVAEAVEVRGELELRGSLGFLRVDPAQIRRL